VRTGLIAFLVVAISGCGLLLDPDSELTADASVRDGAIVDSSAPVDAPPQDGPRPDAPPPDAARPDAARPDAPPPDGGRSDTSLVVDAIVRDTGAVDPALCEAALEEAVELGPGVYGSTTTCSESDVVDFDCLGTTGVPEAYYFVNATTEVTVTVSSGSGSDGFDLASVDTDCSLVTCASSPLTIPAGTVAYFVVENLGGGCAATYSIHAMSGTP
jgi:hypothetical protein